MNRSARIFYATCQPIPHTYVHACHIYEIYLTYTLYLALLLIVSFIELLMQ